MKHDMAVKNEGEQKDIKESSKINVEIEEANTSDWRERMRDRYRERERDKIAKEQ